MRLAPAHSVSDLQSGGVNTADPARPPLCSFRPSAQPSSLFAPLFSSCPCFWANRIMTDLVNIYSGGCARQRQVRRDAFDRVHGAETLTAPLTDNGEGMFLPQHFGRCAVLARAVRCRVV